MKQTEHNINLYPLKFKPILKKMIWGGDKISKLKQMDEIQNEVGESWEISGLEDSTSVVSEGYLSGKTLIEIIQMYKSQLVGRKVYDKFGDTFPLLIKFIDAQENLSIQVHPDDKLAKELHDSFGKTEMWYVVQAQPYAFLYSGFTKKITPDIYVEKVKDGTFVETLKKIEVKEGDVFFLPAGRVHAIGAGCLIAEIQQTSNITYRIFDYNRKDKNGKMRELHTEQAKLAIDFEDDDANKIDYTDKANSPVELVACPYFTTNLIMSDSSVWRDYSLIDSFVAYVCVGGAGVIKDNKNNTISIYKGETVLLPADTSTVIVSTEDNLKILETFVQ